MLRQMKEPLIPYRQYEAFSKLIDIGNVNTETVRGIIEEMPAINQRTLKFICEFLNHVDMPD